MLAEMVKNGGPGRMPGQRSLAAIAGLRLAGLSAFLLALVSLTPVDRTACFALLALAFVCTLPYAIWFRGLGLTDKMAQLHFVVDLTVITGFAAAMSGHRGDLLLVFALVAFSAAVVLSLRRSVETMLLTAAASALALYYPLPGVAVDLTPQAAAMHGAILALFYLAGLLVARRCGHNDARAAQLRRLAEILLRHLPAGLMLLDENDRILLANDRACELLRQREDDLRGRPFGGLLVAGDQPEPAADATIATPVTSRFGRADGTTFTAHVDTARLSLTQAAQPESDKPLELRVVTINDITRLVELQKQIKDTERLRTAASMAAQFAHEVRNPVAAISGSAQLLERLERNARGGAKAKAPCSEAEQADLCACIVSESTRLDEIIEKFLSFTEYTDARLQLLMRLAEETEPSTRPAVRAQ